MIPYVTSSRRTIKQYLKVSHLLSLFTLAHLFVRQACLSLWSTADDTVRIASILAIRRLACASDESILDLILKVSVQTKNPSDSRTPLFSLEYLPNISEIFEEYQCSFLAVHQLHKKLRL